MRFLKEQEVKMKKQQSHFKKQVSAKIKEGQQKVEGRPEGKREKQLEVRKKRLDEEEEIKQE